MSSGCVPIVTNLGGHKEIINNNEDGILWNTVEELINETNLLIKNPNRLKKLSQMAIQKSKMFSTSNFYEKIDSLVGHRRNS
jgi:glycosyltransferase involved in cell wall biosynthesis